MLAKVPEMDSAFSVAGFSFGGSASNRALIFAGLKDFDKRKGEEHSGDAVLERLRGPLSAISGAQVVPFAPPAVQGLGQFGGFQFVLRGSGGRFDAGSRERHAKSNPGRKPESESHADCSPASAPTIRNSSSISIAKSAKALGVSLNQITDALQVYMGSVYVNDFDFNNRAYRVYVQADKQFRAEPSDIKEYYVRSDKGMMVPLENLVTLESQAVAAGDQPLQSFPLRGN